MTYRIQVLINRGKKDEYWDFVRPTGGSPYEYPTKDEAIRAARLCYDIAAAIKRNQAVSHAEYANRAFPGRDICSTPCYNFPLCGCGQRRRETKSATLLGNDKS